LALLLVPAGAGMTGATPRSRHLDAAILYAFYCGYKPGDAMPLRDDEPVPGCGCELCTGIPADSPARTPPRRSRQHLSRRLDVDAARAVPLLDVARALGLEPVQPYPRSRDWLVRCPLHDDSRPSLRLDPVKGLWHCFPCGEGGDGLRLVERVRGCDFAAAVRELAP
jgi:hypothetical protein